MTGIFRRYYFLSKMKIDNDKENDMRRSARSGMERCLSGRPEVILGCCFCTIFLDKQYDRILMALPIFVAILLSTVATVFLALRVGLDRISSVMRLEIQ